jgi:hypothetical protein
VLQYGAVDAPERWPAELSLAMIADEQHTWIRTPAWSALLDSERALHATSSRSTEKMLSEQLFVKPDDRWEISQIADRRRDIVARHYQLAELFRRAIAVADRSQLPPLEEDLHNLLR